MDLLNNYSSARLDVNGLSVPKQKLDVSSVVPGISKDDIVTTGLSQPSPDKLLQSQLLNQPISIKVSSYQKPLNEDSSSKFLVQQQYIIKVNGHIGLSEQSQNTDELFNKVKQAIEHSDNVHQNITDIFKHLGQLDKNTESYLVASQSYIENNLQNALPTHNKENEFVKGSSLIDFPSKGSKISYVVETLEGDTVTVSYRTDTHSLGKESGFSGLLYQVDGELSEEEHQALNQLFVGTAEYVGQVAGGHQSESGLDSINIAESFDMSLLKGFSIDTKEFANQTSFYYQVNQQTQEQTLSVDMNTLSRDAFQHFEFSLTTSLLGSKDQNEVSRYALEMKDLLEEFGFRKGEHEQLNAFIVDSFTSLFDVNTGKGEHGIENLHIPVIGRRVGANQFTSQISSLMDYTYSLNLDENKDGPDEVNTRVDMSQTTESQKVGQLYEFTQQKNFSLYSSISTPSRLPEIAKDIVITTRKEELENKIILDGIQNSFNFTSKHNLDNRIEDTRIYSDGSSKTLVTEEAIVELSVLKLVDDILSNMYQSTKETKQESSEKEERDGPSIITGKSKALDVYIQYDELKFI